MSTPVAKQIALRLKAKNLSAATLAKEASLKVHAVSNILRGSSKQPSAETLLAIADVLGCTVRDLLEQNDVLTLQDMPSDSRDIFMDETHENSNLLLNVVEFVTNHIHKKNYTLTNKQIFTCIEEIYLHSIQNKDVNKQFGEWFIELTKN